MRPTLSILLVILSFSAAVADDLYRVSVDSHSDADRLRSTGLEPIVSLRNGYLVLADQETAGLLQSSGLTHELIANDIRMDQLAFDQRPDRVNVDRYHLLFEEDNLRLFQIPGPSPATGKDGLRPLRPTRVPVRYTSPARLNEKMLFGEVGLDSLISLVSQDTIQAYNEHLQAYETRLAGTPSNWESASWIAQKFQSFGYDSVVIDNFIGEQLWDYHPVLCQNVFATKVGSRYPEKYVVVCGHRDAVPDCPGADDNGSGTVGVLEVARALRDIETEMTMIFIGLDSEESGLHGAYHYADNARDRGDEIVYALNMDMIAHYTNDTEANLYQGNEIVYSQLWAALADSLVGITAHLRGSSGGSDHYAFQANGFDATFVQERDFSPNWHDPTDSTTYMNFEYMKRMIQASLATVYTVTLALPPVDITFIRDGGDGQSLQINWTPLDPSQVDHCTVYYTAAQPESVVVAGTESSAVVAGLTEDVEYTFHVIAYSDEGTSSLTYHEASARPRSIPAVPDDLTAYPFLNGIRLEWRSDRVEMDFDHFTIVRDGVPLPDPVYDSFYVDSDPSLGTGFHYYHVASVDIDGYSSNLSGVPPVEMKIATLTPGSIMAVNRSSEQSVALVDHSITEGFLREALAEYSFNYFGDSLPAARPVSLNDLIDHELIVIGAESGGIDDIGDDPELGGILDTISYYLSIGGKVIVFGRWGDMNADFSPDDVETTCYAPGSSGGAFYDYFNIDCRIAPLSVLDLVDTTLISDLVGAHSQQTDYPDIAWDSITTLAHTGLVFTGVSGIPCPSLPIFAGADIDTIYTYDSSTDSVLTEGKPMAWRSLGGEFEYVFFELPLSFMERIPAVAALRRAVRDLGIEIDDDADDDGVPDIDDNCPAVANPGQEDLDEDGAGDLCDDDIDGDSVLNTVDNCPLAANPGQEDTNDDGIGDACCCGLYTSGLTGNANCGDDGKITLSDITQLIDIVYISKQPLCCTANGNTNGSEDNKITLSDISRLIDHVYISKAPTVPCM